MEPDQNYEYDAPKWFDFNAENEFDDDLSLDDSWFEREHPLHEPKDPSIHSAAVKPLISGFQGSKTESSKTKPQGKKLIKKDFNSKKSLGLNTIRTQRGEVNLNRFLAANAGLVVIPVARIGPKLCSLSIGDKDPPVNGSIDI